MYVYIYILYVKHCRFHTDSSMVSSFEAAALAWMRYLARSKSCLVDLMQGQLRSSLCCLRCGHKSRWGVLALGGSQNGGTLVPSKAIFSGDIPLHSPKE